MNGAGGGAALSTLALMHGLRRHGIESSAVCHAAGTPAEVARLHGATRERVLMTPLYWWNRKTRTELWKRPLFELLQGVQTGWARLSARRIADFAREVGADLIHTNTILTPDGARAARALGIPHVWHVRELTGPGAPFELRRSGASLGRYLSKYASCVVANSPSSAQPLASVIPQERLHVIPNAIDVDRFTVRDHGSDDRAVVAMVASLTSRVKNHPLFLKIAAKLESPSVDLRIYGHDPCDGGRQTKSSYCREIHDLIAGLGLAGRVEFPGFVAQPEKIMSSIDVLVHPVPHESFGRIVVEAMAAGVPVAGIAAGGVGDLVLDGETGCLVPPGPDEVVSSQLASAIDRLVTDPDLRRVLGHRGRQVAERDYSIEPHLERMVEAYGQAVENHTSASAVAR